MDGVVLALDTGGTKIAGGLVTADGRILRPLHREKPFDERRDPGLRHLVAAAHELFAAATAEGHTLRAIGAGFPEYVDAAGRLTSREVLDWEKQPADLLGGLVGGAPVVTESDVRCAALAEARRGAGAGLASFVYVTAGTGLSSAVVLDGRPLPGRRGEAIALGELPVPDLPGERLESYCSGEGIRRRYAAASGRPATGAREVIAAAEGGEPEAVGIVESAARALGESLAGLVALLDPDAIVLGGGMAEAPDAWWGPLSAAFAAGVAARPAAPPLVRAALGPGAGLLGAGLVAWEAVAARRP